jgi:uncharacterized protein YbaA (DUF1428 family)
MALYVDGYVVPIPRKNVQAYRRIAQKAGRIWRKYGALEFRECVGDDLKMKGHVSFPRLARAKPGETVLFSWVVYRSRAHRDRVNRKLRKDPAIASMSGKTMPFDMRRMAYGGFKVLVDA